MQDQRLAQQDGHHACRKSDVAAQPHHHIGLDAAQHLNALPECLEQAQRQQRQRDQALATQTAKVNRFKGKALRRDQLAFHAGLSRFATATEPVHAPALVAQRLGHRQARENVPARAASHDQGTLAHTRPPCINVRFS